MIAADTSSLIAYFQGQEAEDTIRIDEALEFNSLILPPIVLSEFFSDPNINKDFAKEILVLPVLNPLQGFWERSGRTRAKILQKKLKARLPDTLIAQSCIDHNITLITRDADFDNFAKHTGLKVYIYRPN